MGDWISELFSNEYYFDNKEEDTIANWQRTDKDGYVDLTNGIYKELCCAIRIAFDLLITPSVGVAGFFITDLKKAFDGVIPDWICKLFGTDLNDAQDDVMIWL